MGFIRACYRLRHHEPSSVAGRCRLNLNSELYTHMQTFRHLSYRHLRTLVSLARLSPALGGFLRAALPLLIACSALSAHATSVLESWNDVHGATNGMPLNALNNIAGGVGGVGFLTKYEQTGSGVAVLRTNDLKVNLTHYVSGQTSITQHWSLAAVTTSSGAARRSQTRSTPAMYGTVWFSFLASLQNTNGDVALTFNGTFSGSGVPNNGSTGMRVGLGNNSIARCRGAIGVGPIMASSTVVADLSSITNGVNGMVSANNVIPTDGTAGVVLGCIDNDPSGYPRVRLWYNPDVPDAASLPAPIITFLDTNFLVVPSSVTRIGYQNNRTPAPATQNEVMDNVKMSDEPTGFDIVYLNAPLPIPTFSVVATVPVGNDVGPTNVVFTINSDRVLPNAMTLLYTLSGVATNGYIPFSSPATYYFADYIDPYFDPNTMTSAVTIPAGQTNATVTLQVTDNGLPKAIESVILTLTPATDNSYLLGAGSASAVIVPANLANTSVQYMLVNNFVPQIWDTNLTATSVNPNGIGTGWSTVYNNSGYAAYGYPAPNSCLSLPSNVVATNDEASALAASSYISFSLGPIPGRAMTLTNLQFMSLYGNYLNQNPFATGAVVFVRSSLDNFAADLGSFAMVPAETLFPNGGWYTNFITFGSAFSNVPSAVEFRLYVYDDTKSVNQVAVRLGNIFIAGTSAPLAAGINQVFVNTTATNAALGGAPGQFTLTRLGDTNIPLTVSYTMSGTASNGVDYVLLPGSVTIPAGETNVVVNLTPLPPAAGAPAPINNQTATLSLAAGPSYGVLTPASGTVTLAPRGGLASWYFNEGNNSVASLSAVAVPVLTTNTLAALNAGSGPGLGAFGANNGGGFGIGYATSQWRSAPTTIYINGNYWGTNEDATVARDSYVSFSVGALPGNTLTLTEFDAWVEMNPTFGQTNWAVLRSSLDNFTSDLGSVVVPATTNSNAFFQWTAPLNIVGWPGAIEFRVYIYGSRNSGGDIFRLDDVTFLGSTASGAAATKSVNVAATFNAVEPGIPGAFTLTRTGDASAALTVNYALGGSARNGQDYSFLNSSATFPAGVTNLTIPVSGIPNTNPATSMTVTLAVLTNANYFPGLPVSGFVNITAVTAPFITSFSLAGGTVTINFSSATSDTVALVHLQSATAVTGQYTDDSTAVITGGAGVFQATTSATGAARFYRIRR
jgi:Calx-beta domain